MLDNIANIKLARNYWFYIAICYVRFSLLNNFFAEFTFSNRVFLIDIKRKRDGYLVSPLAKLSPAASVLYESEKPFLNGHNIMIEYIVEMLEKRMGTMRINDLVVDSKLYTQKAVLQN